jgi:hypothetical protein
MEAMIAAILMDGEARSEISLEDDTFGKIREPAIRFTHWARAFHASTITPQNTFYPYDPAVRAPLGQDPYEATSVFNFYRPGYVAPGSSTGAAGMTVPELQITNSSTMVGYANFISFFAFGVARNGNERHRSSFLPNYAQELPLASDPAALVDHLNTKLVSGAMTDETRSNIVQAISSLPLTNENNSSYNGREQRVAMAVLLTMTSPDYIVQR